MNREYQIAQLEISIAMVTDVASGVRKLAKAFEPTKALRSSRSPTPTRRCCEWKLARKSREESARSLRKSFPDDPIRVAHMTQSKGRKTITNIAQWTVLGAHFLRFSLFARERKEKSVNFQCRATWKALRKFSLLLLSESLFIRFVSVTPFSWTCASLPRVTEFLLEKLRKIDSEVNWFRNLLWN